MRTTTILLVLMILMAIPAAVVRAGDEPAIGVLGDSYSDEYQFYAPHRSTSRNWVEFLAAVRGLNFGQFSASGWGEPRNQGYEYNWARSDATTEDLIETGQHTGLAVQVARGQVKLVVIFIGGNDFIHALESSEPERALERVAPRASANYRTVVRTVLGASPEVRVVLATVPDVRELPQFTRALRAGRLSPASVDLCSAAMRSFNAQIRSTALGHDRIALVDLDLVVRLANMRSRSSAWLAGRKLNRTETGNDLDHLFLDDDRHIGTIAQGQMAQMVVNAVNTKFAARIAPIEDRDILAFARSIPTRSGPGNTVARVGQSPSSEGPSRSRIGDSR